MQMTSWKKLDVKLSAVFQEKQKIYYISVLHTIQTTFQGKRQSPINIDPGLLQYDPNLLAVSIDKQGVSGKVVNTGQTLVFKVEEGQLAINITGGPLAYKYQFEVNRELIFIFETRFSLIFSLHHIHS